MREVNSQIDNNKIFINCVLYRIDQNNSDKFTIIYDIKQKKLPNSVIFTFSIFITLFYSHTYTFFLIFIIKSNYETYKM